MCGFGLQTILDATANPAGTSSSLNGGDTDPKLYQALRRLLEPGAMRSVANAESWGLLPGAVYHRRLLADEVSARANYFSEAFGSVSEVSL